MTTALDTAMTPDRADQPARSGVSLTDLWLLLTTTIWGANYAVVKYGTDHMDALAFNGARILMATLAFGVLAVWQRRRPGARPLSRRDALLLLALGVLGNCIYQTLFAEGVAHTRAGSAALLLAASPALIAVIGRWLGVERIGAKGYGGVALSMLGIALVVLGGSMHEAAGGSLTGDAIVIAAAVCWAWYTVLLKPLADRVSLIDISALTLVGGMIPLLFISAPSFAATAWRSVTPQTWGAMVFAGIGSLVIGYLGWYRGVRVLGPTRTAIYSNLQPVIALGVAWMMLGEQPTAWQGAGAVTIIAGVVLTRA
ncbi:MAG TPA: DMT family transporter [Gemmatimonadaceae bacterium]|nr:DMT family transporter [Gemmatimonadaceae bacterium]